ncbi:MAG: type I restriction endonuclease [Pseudomonadota bacterium]|uniref:Type I restriction enzyme R protein N-terminal domain-containing protein n=1 Tax=Gallaecimonas pentaromativorans TaxID=584787 RepID=A0A3N1PB46_9GAMM|nr:type I restriction endonuclease [Gallaecimonas pentaromativorans]MED5524605.1 type I restriction endonuclease [Pseudomonadota bacterium]ROQ28612.1 hypothetical protein EDC28_103205 [Gallaecimonas pentaromativorans]
MDLVDKLTELAARIRRQKDSVQTEEATKTAFVLPFIQALGYDVFNPAEVVPELIADHSVKKGEKVDYGVVQDGNIVMLIECKAVGADLATKHAGQLFRYFSVTDARFGVLTDGLKYLFFSDLEKENKMDDRPFFEFDMLSFGETEVEELKKFTKSRFDLDTIIGTASNLKYHRALLAEIANEYAAPSEDLVRILTARVQNGRFTQQIKEQFTVLTKKAFEAFVREQVNARLKNALDADAELRSEAGPIIVDRGSLTESMEDDSGIVTTEEEISAYRIIQAIAAEQVDVERVAMRDSKTYCAILMDDNNRKPICRLHFLKTKKFVTVFTPDGEEKTDVEKVSDIFGLREKIAAAIAQYQI